MFNKTLSITEKLIIIGQFSSFLVLASFLITGIAQQSQKLQQNIENYQDTELQLDPNIIEI